MKKKAICLLSGGLDSATVLYWACHEGYEIYALTVHYGQIHEREIESANAIAQRMNVTHEVVALNLPWKGSSLLDSELQIPTDRNEIIMQNDIPSTYVPARNSIFLSLAASYAEAKEAGTILIGANEIDYSGYPDCRPEFIDAFNIVLRKGTKAGVEGNGIRIVAPLLRKNKKEIVELGLSLGVPFEMTWSCYKGQKYPCGICDSCKLRAKGFRENYISDPLMAYVLS